MSVDITKRDNRVLSILLTLVTSVGAHQLFALSSNLKSNWISASCKAVPITDKYVNGRASVIRFPNGREITLVGHQHGERQVLAMADQIQSGEISGMSDKEFEDLLRAILKENTASAPSGETSHNLLRTIIFERLDWEFEKSNPLDNKNADPSRIGSVLKDALGDHAYLTQKVSSNPSAIHPIEFVGHESMAHETEKIFEISLRSIDFLKKEYAKRAAQGKISLTHKQFNAIVLSASNGPFFFYSENRKLLNKIPLIGTESEDVIRDYRIEPSLEPLKLALEKLPLLKRLLSGTLSEKDHEFLKGNPRYKEFYGRIALIYIGVGTMKIASLEEFESEIRQLGPIPYPLKMDSEVALSLARQHIGNNNAREWASAETLANRNQNGIHFVGINHFRGTINNLERICAREELARFSYKSSELLEKQFGAQ